MARKKTKAFVDRYFRFWTNLLYDTMANARDDIFKNVFDKHPDQMTKEVSKAIEDRLVVELTYFVETIQNAEGKTKRSKHRELADKGSDS